MNPNDAVLLILEGAVDVTVGDRSLRLSQGEMVLLPAGEPHALLPGEPFKMLLTLLRAPHTR